MPKYIQLFGNCYGFCSLRYLEKYTKLGLVVHHTLNGSSQFIEEFYTKISKALVVIIFLLIIIILILFVLSHLHSSL